MIDLIHRRKNCPTGMISGWVQKVTKHYGTKQYIGKSKITIGDLFPVWRKTKNTHGTRLYQSRGPVTPIHRWTPVWPLQTSATQLTLPPYEGMHKLTKQHGITACPDKARNVIIQILCTIIYRVWKRVHGVWAAKMVTSIRRRKPVSVGKLRFQETQHRHWPRGRARSRNGTNPTPGNRWNWSRPVVGDRQLVPLLYTHRYTRAIPKLLPLHWHLEHWTKQKTILLMAKWKRK